MVPIEILTEDSTFARLSEQPIPKGAEKERKQYLNILESKQRALLDLQEKERKASRRFSYFRKTDLAALSEIETELAKRMEKMNKKVNEWINDITTNLSAFVGAPEKAQSIETEKDVDSLVGYVIKRADKKEGVYTNSLNEKLQSLGLAVEVFSSKEINRVIKKLEKERLELPSYREIQKSLDDRKEEWRLLDDTFSDLKVVPSMVDRTIPVLSAIISEGVDETKLKEAIEKTYNNIIKNMKERKLIKAVAEMEKGNIQARVKYKNKRITHPGGAEKAFFSLAILTALAQYLVCPY